MVYGTGEKLNPSHRFAAGSRPKVHRTFDLSLAPPVHKATGGHGFFIYLRNHKHSNLWKRYTST